MKIRDSDSTALRHTVGTLQSQEVTQFKVETLSQNVGYVFALHLTPHFDRPGMWRAQCAAMQCGWVRGVWLTPRSQLREHLHSGQLQHGT